MPFDTKFSLWEEDVLSGQDALAGLELPFGPRMPFLGRGRPIEPGIPFHITNAISCREYPFLSQKTTTNHIRRQKQQSAMTGVAVSLSLFPPCDLGLINQLKYVVKTVCHVFHHVLLTGLEKHSKGVNR